jgi:hypothetical protein
MEIEEIDKKILSLDQLKVIVGNVKTHLEKIETDPSYLRRRTLKKSINELKTTVSQTTRTGVQIASELAGRFASQVARQAGQLATQASKAYKYLFDGSDNLDELYLLLAVLLTSDDNEIDDYLLNDEDEDALLLLLAVLLMGPESRGPSLVSNDVNELSDTFRKELLTMDYSVLFDYTFSDDNYIYVAMLNQIFSFLILSDFLKTNGNKVCFPNINMAIPGENHRILTNYHITNENLVSIGTEMALNQ